MTHEIQMVRYFVALLDICGQADAVAELGELFEQQNDQEKLRKQLSQVFSPIVNVRERFLNWHEGQNELIDSFSHQPDKDPEFVEEFKKAPIKVYGFSDYSVIYFPLTPDVCRLNPINVYSALRVSGLVVLYSLANRVAVRGGIDIGGASEVPGSQTEIYGPAFLSAYNLERKAGYPRLLVGDRLVSYLDSHIQEPDLDKWTLRNRIASQHAKTLIVKDKDSESIVDFLGASLKASIELRHQDFMRNDIVTAAWKFAKESLEESRNSGNAKLEKRYGQLVAYMRERLPVWGIAFDRS